MLTHVGLKLTALWTSDLLKSIEEVFSFLFFAIILTEMYIVS